MEIRAMTMQDWERVRAIYTQGLDSGRATFNTQCPSWEEWDAGHHTVCRYVAVCEKEVAGFAAVTPTSGRAPYRGVVEVSIYVDEAYQHKGIGTALLNALIQEAPAHGFWCLYAAIFSINESSIQLHRNCGFRTIGKRERIAKDRFGNWQDTTLMEYRLPDLLVTNI